MLGMIWAQAHDGVIGRDNDLPWHLPEDLKHFRRTTSGDAVVMGRRQWESLPQKVRPLPGRTNVVLTRDRGYAAPGAQVVGSLHEALELVADQDAWICGGGQVYEAALPFADRLVVTEIDLEVTGDTYAPAIGPQWREDDAGDWLRSADGTAYRILTYRRS